MWHDQIIAKRFMGINNTNDLQTHQGLDSKHMQKSTVLTKNYWANTLLHINIVICDRLTCNVNQVYMYIILVESIYAFLITTGFLI